MFTYIKILVVCSLAGCVLASLFVGQDAAMAGAAKGFLIGILITWAEWKFKHSGSGSETQRQRGAERAVARVK